MIHKGRRTIAVSKLSAVEASTAEPFIRGTVIPSTQFPPNIMDVICQRTLEGESLKTIGQDPDMPVKATLLQWLNRDPAFMDRYLDCQRIYALDGASQMQDIADGKTLVEIQKVTKDSNGEEITTFLSMSEDVNRSALRVKTIQWRLAKLLPKVFGDKLQAEHSLTGDLAKLLEDVSNAGHNLPTKT